MPRLLDQARKLVRSDLPPGASESAAAVVTSAYVALYEDGDRARRASRTSLRGSRACEKTARTSPLTY
ncbi:hypothetical protein GCM10020219_002350 [Nonomuraea dietziae]